MLQKILLVAAGGACGSVARLLIGEWLLDSNSIIRAPWHTFIINLSGCLLIGLLTGYFLKYGPMPNELRLLLITGVLGGFTTFSAFGLETVTLIQQGSSMVAVAYVLASVVLGIGAVAAGMACFR